MRTLLFGAIALFIATHSANADGWTGNDLLDTCKDTGASTTAFTSAKGMCLGYVVGAYETFAEVLPQAACADKGVTNGQLVDIVVKFLVLYPEKRNQPAPLLVGAAVASAFACPAIKNDSLKGR